MKRLDKSSPETLTDPQAAQRPLGDLLRLGFADKTYVLHLWTVFGLALSNALLGLATLAVVAGRRWQLDGTGLTRDSEVRWKDFFWPALYALWLLVSVGFSYHPSGSVSALSECFSLATFVLGVLLVRDEWLARRIVDGVIWMATAAAVVGLVQLAMGGGGLEARIRGPFSHYMTFAGVLLTAIAFLLARLLSRRGATGRGLGGGMGRGLGRWTAWPCLLLMVIALFGSLTRSAWVALFVTLTVLLFARSPRWVAAYVPAAVLFLLLAPVHVLQRVGSIFDLGDASNYDRLCMVEAGLRMVHERPLTGLGPEMVGELYPIYRHSTAPRVEAAHLHNAWMQIAAERGLPALMVLTGWVFGTAAMCFSAFHRQGRFDGPRADLLLGAFLALVAFAVAGCFEDNWGDTELQRLIFFVLALPLGLRGVGDSNDPRNHRGEVMGESANE